MNFELLVFILTYVGTHIPLIAVTVIYHKGKFIIITDFFKRYYIDNCTQKIYRCSA